MSAALLYGELRTGLITGSIEAITAPWEQVLDGSGKVGNVLVPADVVREQELYEHAAETRTFLAVEEDDEIRQAGPIWLHDWSWESQQLTLAATGLWGLFDYRRVIPVLTAGQRVQDVSTTISGTDFGGIARDLVAQAMTHVGGDLPIVLPTRQPGTRTETFHGWALPGLGEQLRQLTQRETAAPNIEFRPRRNPADKRYIQWEMLTGTEADPYLQQTGDDWVFDTTTDESPVRGIAVRGDGTVMGSRAWVLGEGTEAGTVIGSASSSYLTDQRFPLLEVFERRPSVSVQATADGHATALLGRSSRRVQQWRVTVDAAAARGVRAGHYARIVIADDAYLPDGERRCRIRALSGDPLSDDKVILDMLPLAVP